MIFEDKLIIENAMNLWVGLVDYDSTIIEEF
jgi:hypothetical protein